MSCSASPLCSAALGREEVMDRLEKRGRDNGKQVEGVKEHENRLEDRKSEGKN